MPALSQSLYFTNGTDSNGNATNRNTDSNGNLIKSSTLIYPPQTSGTLTFYTEKEKGDGYYNGKGVHTVTYVPWREGGMIQQGEANPFRGSVVMQATLAAEPTENDWFDVPQTYTEFTEQYHSNTFHNFQGNFVWIRAKVVFNQGVLLQILYSH